MGFLRGTRELSFHDSAGEKKRDTIKPERRAANPAKKKKKRLAVSHERAIQCQTQASRPGCLHLPGSQGHKPRAQSAAGHHRCRSWQPQIPPLGAQAKSCCSSPGGTSSEAQLEKKKVTGTTAPRLREPLSVGGRGHSPPQLVSETGTGRAAGRSTTHTGP